MLNDILGGKYNKAIAAVVVGVISYLLPVIGVNLNPQVKDAITTLASAFAVYQVANKG